MTLQARKRTAAPEADEHTAADAAPQPAARRAAGTWAARRGSSSWHAGLAICAIALVGAVAYMAPSVSAGRHLLNVDMQVLQAAVRGLKEANMFDAASMQQAYPGGTTPASAILSNPTPAPAPAPVAAPKPAPAPTAAPAAASAGANVVAIPATLLAPVAATPTTVGSGGINIVTSTPVSVSNPITIKSGTLTKALGSGGLLGTGGPGNNPISNIKQGLGDLVGGLLG